LTTRAKEISKRSDFPAYIFFAEPRGNVTAPGAAYRSLFPGATRRRPRGCGERGDLE
jgi:hypothetical protein